MNDDNKALLAELTAIVKAEEENLLRYAAYRLGNAGDAKDAVQEAFLKLYRHASEADAGKICGTKCYLFRTLANTCTDMQRRLARSRTIPISMKLDMAEQQDEGFEQDFTRINRLLGLIPENQAEVIRLRIYGGKSFAEIAGILSLPLPTVKSRFIYGLEKIRRGMKKD